METRFIVLLIIAPFALTFIYAIWHEYRRYKREGASSYGLTYDPETNTTHVGTLEDDADGFDPEEFNPEDTPDTGQTDDTDADSKEQETKS
ncbi:hypothetical protein [Yoonia sp.]|uniref:hypothetical protein n=1 Tax=Yoonia sp. TaxID=2212373 RepID=UPI001A058BE0|nr:hypothetical protein [Yoonia sp.]MBE0413313.1 hypothetical protein [Yoonia sp.]